MSITQAGLSDAASYHLSTRDKLREVCKERGLTGYGRLGKDDLIKKLISATISASRSSISAPAIHTAAPAISANEQQAVESKIRDPPGTTAVIPLKQSHKKIVKMPVVPLAGESADGNTVDVFDLPPPPPPAKHRISSTNLNHRPPSLTMHSDPTCQRGPGDIDVDTNKSKTKTAGKSKTMPDPLSASLAPPLKKTKNSANGAYNHVVSNTMPYEQTSPVSTALATGIPILSPSVPVDVHPGVTSLEKSSSRSAPDTILAMASPNAPISNKQQTQNNGKSSQFTVPARPKKSKKKVVKPTPAVSSGINALGSHPGGALLGSTTLGDTPLSNALLKETLPAIFPANTATVNPVTSNNNSAPVSSITSSSKVSTLTISSDNVHQSEPLSAVLDKTKAKTKKRPGPPISAPEPPTKKAKKPVPVSATISSSMTLKTPLLPNLAHKEIASGRPTTGPLTNAQSANTPKGKRFVPLVALRPPAKTATINVSPPSRHNSSVNAPFTFDRPPKVPPPPRKLILKPITLPPSVTQRRHVSRMAILLSRVFVDDLPSCALVSRTFRYAVYLSAVPRLMREFGGRRLAVFMQGYALNMTNMWPYLLQRQQEVQTRKRIYAESFLGRALKHANPLSERLWTSPDHERQTFIALKFAITRLWFLVSVGGEADSAGEYAPEPIVDAQELVNGEIWTIATRSRIDPMQVRKFFVLEATCEVIGSPPDDQHGGKSGTPVDNCTIPLRADWAAYIAHRLLPSSVHDEPPKPLLHHLAWTNHEEYTQGISKIWLARIAKEGAAGAEKRRVAERYVLACVVGNSVSGRYMSATEMAQEDAGLPGGIALQRSRTPKIHLFLPAHHHVESLDFVAANKAPLHPALAVVQTPAREYYILRDNGMQVGCEEDMIAPVWMVLLGCCRLGTITLPN